MSETATAVSHASGSQGLTSFNARTMSALQVAASFVPPPSFEVLIRPDNSLLSGPRGSGKTTLLKMLQPEALEAWNDPRAADIRSSVHYSGVFIATDRTWKQQLFPSGYGESSIEGLEYIADAAFATHVLREIVSVMAFRVHSPEPPIRSPHPRVRLAPSDEARLVGNLARLARLSVDVPNLHGVADALTLRLAELGSYRTAVRETQDLSLPRWMNFGCLDLAEAAIDLFNTTANEREHQWALLFDELELAPPRIVHSLLDAMRGQGGRILFKLSLSPVQPELARLQLPNSGVHGQDFEFIRLTYAGQREAQIFATALVSAELSRRYNADTTIEQLLGPSAFNSREDSEAEKGKTSKKGRRNPYSKGSSLWHSYVSLAKADSSFAEWLKERDVDLDNLEALSPSERAAKLRKVRNLVVVREFYRRPDAGRRSRKSYDLYCGADAMLTFVDGNPRMLKALLGQLLPTSLRSIDRMPIPTSEQSKAIESIMGRFLSLIRSLPGVMLSQDKAYRVSDLIDAIGEELAYGVIEAPFRDNVPIAFKVDGGLPPYIIEGLQLALNAGAIVHIPRDPGKQIPANLRGEMFRLSYVLAPHYGLPLRLGPAVSLRRLLSRGRSRNLLFLNQQGSRRAHQPRLATGPKQSSLFDEE